MIKSFFANRRWFKWAYGIGITLLLLILSQVYISVLFNEWYKEFYDILQDAKNQEVAAFYDSLLTFMKLAMPYIVIFSFTNWLTKMYSLRWREAMTTDYILKWRYCNATIEGASQRIQQDTERFSRLVEGLGLQVVRAVMTLVAFIPILWGLSSGVDIPYLSDIPGSLMWLALLVSLGGMVISWFVGWYLPGLEYNNQVKEAAYRKQLVLAEDDRQKYGGFVKLSELFTGVRINYQRLFMHYGYFDLWAITFDQILTVVPYLIMGHGLFTGVITLGVMIQVSNAFGKVQNSFSLFIHNWTTITELRSIWKRLHEFEKALERNEDEKIIDDSVMFG